MRAQYRHNHYVPVWYQKRFLPPGQIDQELQYLDFQPGFFIDGRGVRHEKRAVKRLGFKFCFAQDDLYTVNLQGVDYTQVEQTFFGPIDSNGRDAVAFWDSFDHRTGYSGKKPDDPFNDLMLYMSTQKLRTPKGLGWLTEQARLRGRSDDKNMMLRAMIDLRSLHNAVWTECVWQIADADQSQTKFIVSDHPVTVYNKRCGPRSQWCRGHNDPEIWLQGTHTIFPLSLNKISILTNLSWVRNPYQSPVGTRPHPNPYRGAIFNMTKIQTLRHLSEEEVRQINFIMKSRALRYIAAAKEEWLYPETFVSKSDWNTYGRGYLLMPDPRAIAIGGTVMWGGGKGGPGALDEYGRPPWHPDFEKESKSFQEAKTLYRFQGEFARLFGPYRRGQSFDLGDRGIERDSDELHAYHLSLEEKFK
jgi:hypothetical protein